MDFRLYAETHEKIHSKTGIHVRPRFKTEVKRTGPKMSQTAETEKRTTRSQKRSANLSNRSAQLRLT